MGLPLITAGELTGSSTPWPRLPLRSHVLPSLVSSFPCTSWLSLPAEWSLLSQPQSPICTMEMTRGPSAWGCTALTPTSHVLCGLGWVAQPLCLGVPICGGHRGGPSPGCPPRGELGARSALLQPTVLHRVGAPCQDGEGRRYLVGRALAAGEERWGGLCVVCPPS